MTYTRAVFAGLDLAHLDNTAQDALIALFNDASVDLGDVEARVTIAEADIDTAEAAIDVTEADMVTAEAAIVTAEAAIVTAEADIDTAEADIVVLQAAISGLAYQRTFDWEDSDVDVVAGSAAINLGDALPADAFVLAVHASVTEAFDDGSSGTFDLDLGVVGTSNQFLVDGDLDSTAELATPTLYPVIASAEQLLVTIKGNVNLSTLTSGTVVVTVLYSVPVTTVVPAP